MYHLYSGAGTVSDSSGTMRAIHVTAMISDQLWDRSLNQPVQVTPGQVFQGSNSYLFRISDWCIAVDKIGSFAGQTGNFWIQHTNSPMQVIDMGWVLNSDATMQYNWGGSVQIIMDPNSQGWANPSAPNYGQLPLSIRCISPGASPSMGRTILELFVNPPQSFNYNLDFTIKRI